MASRGENTDIADVSEASADAQERRAEALLAALDHGTASGRARAGVFARVRRGLSTRTKTPLPASDAEIVE